MAEVFCYNVESYADKALGDAVENYFSQSEAAKRLCAESRVLLKPNLLAKHKPEAAVTTHPAVLREVIFALQRRGVKSIVVADSPGVAYRPDIMRSIYEVCGLASVCRETNVQLYTECKFSEKSSNGKLCRNWNFIEPVQNCNFIINLPKLKTHMMMNLSCAIKNLFGCIPGLQKPELHMRFPEKEPFGTMLCDLYEAVMPDMNIADGILSMEGNGPAGGSARLSKLILASDNAAMLDLAACKVIGFELSEVPYLAQAVERRLCPSHLESKDVMGPLNKIPGFVHPKSGGQVNFGHALPKPINKLMPAVISITAPHPQIRKNICIGCGKCAEICPAKVISINNKKAEISPKKCIRCFCCHEVCPVKAIDVKSLKLFKL